MTRRRRHILAGITVAVMAVATGIVAVHLSGASARTGPDDRGRRDAARRCHDTWRSCTRRCRATPGMSPRGPGIRRRRRVRGAGLPERHDQRRPGRAGEAPPSTRRSADPSRLARAKKGVWTNVGPSDALYPSTASSATHSTTCPTSTSRADAPRRSPSATFCLPILCRGLDHPGRRWRLAHRRTSARRNPKWIYLGGPLGINAAGAVTIDPNDPLGNTIYVGTGEANICGSGCVAGVGLYKSTNGGITLDRTRSARPSSAARASARS